MNSSTVANASGSLCRQPVFQFLIGGALILLLNSLFYPADDEATIEVDDAALLNFLQVTDKSFNAELSKAKFQKLTRKQRETLEQNYIASEVLYREALSLGLDEYDYVIRKRLIQKMDYLILEHMDQPGRVDEATLNDWFQERIEDYQVAPTASFTHVFFQARSRDLADALLLATETLGKLRAEKVDSDAALQYGERFYFHRDYIDKTPELIESHFGEPFRKEIFRLPVAKWSEPIVSAYGVHLVYVTRLQNRRTPELEEVAGTVLSDYEREQRRDARSKAIEKLTEKYRIERL